jgi:hypothetical protein
MPPVYTVAVKGPQGDKGIDFDDPAFTRIIRSDK